jgi:integrase
VGGYVIWRAENLKQIQFLLGHASVQATERYLACKQRLSQAANDNLELELEGT